MKKKQLHPIQKLSSLSPNFVKKNKKTIVVTILICIAILFIILVYIEVVENVTFPIDGLSFPATTKTKLGFKGDAIDIIIIGDQETLKSSLLKAHWLIPDAITKTTTKKIIIASIQNKSYPNAPVSNLYLYKRKEDMAFELPTNTVRKRHHLRLWKSPYTRSGKSVWVGSDTYDSRIELSPRGFLPTHHVDANIDKETTFLVETVQKVSRVRNVSQARLTFPILLGLNGNGDRYYSNGLVQIITVK